MRVRANLRRIAVLVLGLIAVCALGGERPRCLLISLDGFRWDYPDLYETPAIHEIFARGFRVRRMSPAAPSLTFPNHYTLVTGCLPAHHGLIGNQFRDASDGSRYSLKDPAAVRDPKWYQRPAIWEVAKEQGIESASYFWVGSEMRGRAPAISIPFDDEIPIESRLATLAQWLDPTKDPTPGLMLLYFSQVDHAGHEFGPLSEETKAAVIQLDQMLAKVIALVDDSADPINLVVVADHGMAPLLGQGVRASEIAKAASDDLLELINHHSFVELFLKDPSRTAAVLARLPQAPGLTWYTRDQPPWPLHPTRNGHIMGTVSVGYEVMRDKPGSYRGGHGYDPRVPEMGAVCFGMGPDFRAGSQLVEVNSVDVFALLVQLLRLSEVPSDGRGDVWKPVMQRGEREQ